MMSSSKTNNKERCIGCTKTFLTTKTGFKCDQCVGSMCGFKCDQCAGFLHQRCSRITRQEYLEYKQGVFKSARQFCTDYTCTRCAKHIYYGHNAVFMQ